LSTIGEKNDSWLSKLGSLLGLSGIKTQVQGLEQLHTSLHSLWTLRDACATTGAAYSSRLPERLSETTCLHCLEVDKLMEFVCFNVPHSLTLAT
jgi:hypothetical protein